MSINVIFFTVIWKVRKPAKSVQHSSIVWRAPATTQLRFVLPVTIVQKEQIMPMNILVQQEHTMHMMAKMVQKTVNFAHQDSIVKVSV